MKFEKDSDFVNLAKYGVDSREMHLENDAALMKEFYTNSEPHSFLTTQSWGKYAYEYFRDSIGELACHSYGFFVTNQLISIWNVLSLTSEHPSMVSSPNDPIRPPVFLKTGHTKYRKPVIQSVINFINRTTDQWYSIEEIDTEQDLSEWQRQSLLLGAIPQTRYDLLVDLTKPTDEIWSNIRKSYKPLINKAKNTWNFEVITRPSEDTWKEFSSFHELVSGRVTRSLRSWEIQRQWVCDDLAFAIFLRDNENKLIGAGLFTHNQHQANYFTGVYDRTLFDQPLGHLVQWEAILELQRRGVKKYRIGERSYSGLVPTPTEKDLTISFFKEGFATKTAPVSLLIHKTNPLSERSIDEAQE
jgi:FemAB family protein